MISLLKNERVYLYGIGRLGKKILGLLEFFNVTVKGILVSDCKRLPNKYHGIKIEQFNLANIEKDSFIIIAVPDSIIDDVVDKVKHKQLKYLVWDNEKFEESWLQVSHRFIDRRSNKDKVLFILAGYKEFLWNDVFERVEKFLPDDIEVCILSSGVYCDVLEKRACSNGWSYLSTNINSVTLIQNLAYSIYKDYSWIYKMDEDIFLTQGAIEGLFSAYNEVKDVKPYHIGVIAPLIPLNEYSCRYILHKYGCLEDFEHRFGKLYFGGDGRIINTKEIAPYMWGKYGNIPNIDYMMKDCIDDKEITTCATRYNIGFILFHRTLWEQMHGFFVSGGTDMGADEEELCAYCINMSQPIMVTHNVVVGHFSFGPQEQVMREYMYQQLTK